ncbi:MAG: rod shape-determining protein MreD [Dehalococcoidales bacterium]
MNMRWMRFFIFLLLATLLNAGNVLNTISVSSLQIKPDLLLITLVFFAINIATTDAIVASFVIGFAADISAGPMGPYMITFGVLGSLISQLQKVVLMKRMIHQATAIFVIALVAGGMVQLLSSFKTDEPMSNVYRMILGGAAYSAVAGPLVWMFLSTMALWLGAQPRRHSRLSHR